MPIKCLLLIESFHKYWNLDIESYGALNMGFVEKEVFKKAKATSVFFKSGMTCNVFWPGSKKFFSSYFRVVGHVS
jgi:hypothetical protein